MNPTFESERAAFFGLVVKKKGRQGVKKNITVARLLGSEACVQLYQLIHEHSVEKMYKNRTKKT